MAATDTNDPNYDPTYWGPRTAPISLAPMVAAHPSAPAVKPAITPMGAAPEIAATESGAAPTGIPSMPPPAIAKPTPAQSVAAGQAQHGDTWKQEGQRQFNEMRPEITAQPGTPEFFQQKAGQIEYDKAHPWGGDISAQPGKWGKIAHVAAGIGNVAGDLLAPGLTAMVPGSKLNENVREANALRSMGPAAETQEKQAQTQSVAEGNEEMPHINPVTGQTEMVTRKSLPMIEAAEIKEQSAENVAQTRVGGVDRKTDEARDAALRQHGLMSDPQNPNGAPIPVPDSMLSPQELQTRGLVESTKKLHDAQAEVEKAKNDPNSPQFKLAQQRLQQASAEFQQRTQGLALHQAEFANKQEEQQFVKPSGQTQSRGEAAESALQLLPGLEDAVRANAKSMGPIVGRIARGEIGIGNVDPSVQKFYSQLESFYAMQPSIHGFRNAEFVKDFDAFIGNLQTNPDAVIAGLEGLKPTLEAVNKSGRTFQRRIKEGQSETPTIPAAGGGKLPSFKQFIGGAPQ